MKEVIQRLKQHNKQMPASLLKHIRHMFNVQFDDAPLYVKNNRGVFRAKKDSYQMEQYNEKHKTALEGIPRHKKVVDCPPLIEP